ncbi:SMI1/KNR4 family protein [Shouchella lonarensis]|uniref:Knr4/Smi1-like domain-containing protein n=1 Tax=Shouchella lonarensis TaxID=1464122 RepID=A0A1G6GK64_9BACI|nr:SMI1/KNR4 family protein [Shouchella lonarensis]SDB82334.1 hypothetical protein SAMN05421737_101171 [Shouchella lonarensis]
MSNILEKLPQIYQGDRRVLRNGTVLWGEKDEDLGWHTHTMKGLSRNEIDDLEKRTINIQGPLPSSYRSLLSLANGAYLFDMILIGGLGIRMKGLSYEESSTAPSDLVDDLLYKLSLDNVKKELFQTHFFFAESYVNGTIFALDRDERVIEFINGRVKKKVREFESLLSLLERVFEVGVEHYRTRSFIEF